jgi:hypothetical protein
MLSEDDQWDTAFSIGKFPDIVIEGNSVRFDKTE